MEEEGKGVTSMRKRLNRTLPGTPKILTYLDVLKIELVWYANVILMPNFLNFTVLPQSVTSNIKNATYTKNAFKPFRF